jgi:outer membrane lipoprotein-sorting protein
MTLLFKSPTGLWGISFFLILVALFSPFADSTAITLSPLLSLIRKNYNPETPLSTKFSLTIYWSVREKEEKKQGRIILAPGDRFRVTVGGETFVSNGETFWHYSVGASQATIKQLAAVDRATLPSQIFARYIAAYSFRELERKKGVVQLAWKCDSGGAPYSAIRLEAEETSGRIIRCVMTDRNNNTFTYVFTGTTFGKKYAQETFEFTIPKDARIVDLRN